MPIITSQIFPHLGIPDYCGLHCFVKSSVKIFFWEHFVKPKKIYRKQFKRLKKFFLEDIDSLV